MNYSKRTVLSVVAFFAHGLTVFAATPEVAEVLNIVWRQNISATDHQSDSINFFAYPSDGQFYYALSTQKPDTSPLYRLYNGSDHMTSTEPNEGGYALDATLGYAYDQQLPGTVEVARWYKSSIGDHALQRPGEILGGYVSQSLGATRYAWPRYGTSDTDSMLSLSGGGVTIKSNRSAGGAIFSWMYNGKEYININDYGRQLQTAYFAPHSDAGGAWNINPTEAGSRESFQTISVAQRHGSPLLTAYNDGLTQVTRSIPLDFQLSDFGGDANHPVLWPTARLGKDITLDYNGMGAVAKFETHLVVPAAATGEAEIPTAYMPGDFTSFWTYDAQTGTLTQVFPVSNSNLPVRYEPVFGGVIISTPAQDHAMGVYAVSTAQGGSMSFCNLFNFSNGNGNPVAFDTTKWALGFRGTFDTDNEYVLTSWVISGTLAEVTAHMDSLYAQGVIGAPKAIPLDNSSYPADQREDAVVFKPSNGIWKGSHNQPVPDYVTGATTSQSAAFGTSGDTALVGDVDGDGLADIVTVHPAGNYNWSASHTTDTDNNGAGEMVGGSADSSLIGFGTVAGSSGNFLADMTSDGIDDAVSINAGLNWFCQPSTAGVGFDATTTIQGPLQWGLAGDIPLVGDFNGDGYGDVAVWRPSTAVWFVNKSGPGGLGTGGTLAGQFGLPDDIPLVGDVNGDGRTDGIIARSAGADLFWTAGFADTNGLIDFATGGGFNNLVPFGTTNDIPIVADINGDGRVDIGYVSDNGSGQLLWKFALTTDQGDFTSFAVVSALFGDTGDVPLMGQLDYVDVRITSISTSGAGIAIEWEPSISNRLYTVSWNTNLVTGLFDPLETDIASPQNSYTDTVHNAEDQGFYTVEVQ